MACTVVVVDDGGGTVVVVVVGSGSPEPATVVVGAGTVVDVVPVGAGRTGATTGAVAARPESPEAPVDPGWLVTVVDEDDRCDDRLGNRAEPSDRLAPLVPASVDGEAGAAGRFRPGISSSAGPWLGGSSRPTRRATVTAMKSWSG